MPEHVQLWTKILDSYVWGLPSDQRICAVTLLLLAAQDAGTVRVSLQHLADRADVSRQTARTTLEHLVRGKTITTESTRDGYTITIRNYALYNATATPAQHTLFRLPPGPRLGNKKSAWSSETQAKIIKVLADLNQKAGRQFRLNPTNGKHIAGRLQDGYTTRDLMLVTWDRWVKWRGTKWIEYLRPSTLFGPEKFEEYLPLAHAHEAEMRSDEHKPRVGEQLAFLEELE